MSFYGKSALGTGARKSRRSVSALGQGLSDDRSGRSRHHRQPLPVFLAGLPGSRGRPDAPGPADTQARATRARERLTGFIWTPSSGWSFRTSSMLAIMITAGATLHANGVTDIQTSAQAAQALRPVAGALAETIFALGVIGTGLLSVPVLADRRLMPPERRGNGRRAWPASRWRPRPFTRSFASRQSSG
jgi:hypothetical protein